MPSVNASPVTANKRLIAISSCGTYVANTHIDIEVYWDTTTSSYELTKARPRARKHSNHLLFSFQLHPILLMIQAVRAKDHYRKNGAATILDSTAKSGVPNPVTTAPQLVSRTVGGK
jgi:hypothetical protein